MNARLFDCHIHTPLCRHATGSPAEYVQAAIDAGLGGIGFADHNPMPEPFDDWRMLIDELPRYLEMVQEVRERFPQFPIRLGLECDYIAGKEAWIEKLAGMADWDFLIGSVHYLPEGWEVDHPKYIDRHHGDSVNGLWDGYWKTFEQCIRSGLFDFVAHPDLPKKFGFRPGGDLRRYYEPAIAALVDTGIAFEINTAGLRKPVGEMYPDRAFLKMACESRVPLLINSDAHAPNEVGADFDHAVVLAREVGYRETAQFKKRNRTAVPFV